MRTSDQINELTAALSKAQGEREPNVQESILIPKLANIFNPLNSNNKKKTLEQLFFGKLAFGASDCWYWRGCTDSSGYGRIAAKEIGENFAHRLSWWVFNGPITKSQKVLHKCDIRNCVNPDHLFLGTQRDNVRDMFQKGRANKRKGAYGSQSTNHKLTDEQVQEIRSAYSNKEGSCKTIGLKYGVATMTIHRIITFKAWRQNENI